MRVLKKPCRGEKLVIRTINGEYTLFVKVSEKELIET
jgi:hypothetical protein